MMMFAIETGESSDSCTVFTTTGKSSSCLMVPPSVLKISEPRGLYCPYGQ